jgi:hypothetical protein|tara:strand:- start:135 stop:329 length:195 start_codon:yes stop_codon:yes gene_type:complete
VESRDKNLIMMKKYLVEIANLTFNLVNKEIQNSKLKHKGKVMGPVKINLIRKNRYHHQDNLLIQ